MSAPQHRPMTATMLYAILDRPPVTRAPANDRRERDPALGGRLGTFFMLAVGCGLGFLFATGGVL